MRLYSRTGEAAQTDPETGTTYTPDADGAFEFPEELGERLRRFHVDKKPMWEDSIERQQRLMDEDLDRAKDPATLLAVLQQLVRVLPAPAADSPAAPASIPVAAPAVVETPTAPKQPRKRAATKPAAE